MWEKEAITVREKKNNGGNRLATRQAASQGWSCTEEDGVGRNNGALRVISPSVG